MIAFLTGKVAAVEPPHTAFIEVAGIGYCVSMPSSAIQKLAASEDAVRVFTHMSVGESALALYGFLSEEEKALFERLIGVSGVGPKVALAALSTFSPKELVDAISAQDTTQVARIPGVGKKTASRIILELKGSLEQGMATLFAQEGESGESVALQSATEALLSMGFTSAEAELALKGAEEGLGESALLQYALKRLGSR